MRKIFVIFLIVISFGFGTIARASTLERQFEDLVSGEKLPKDLQSVCVSDKNGSVFSHNADIRVIPASVSKIYTTDWALSALPPDFRYTTEFFVYNQTLYINGGGDPYFVIEHLDKVLHQVYSEKNILIDTIVFSPNFYFNWKQMPYDILQSMLTSIKERPTLPVSKNIRILFGAHAYTGVGTRYTFQSMPIVTLLKQMNNYSSNVVADVLFDRLGGTSAFTDYMKDTYKADENIIRFETGSGLRGNYTTCNLTLDVLEHLEKTLKEKDMKLTDVLTVPKIDPGVLQKRTLDPTLTGAMVAKSGFVNYHQTLAGAINTENGLSYFAVFTTYTHLGNTTSVKYMVDMLAGRILESFQSTLEPFGYILEASPLNNTIITKNTAGHLIPEEVATITSGA